MAHVVACPSSQTLQQFLKASLPSAESHAVEQHLLQCQSCIDTIAKFGDGTFQEFIRRNAQQPSRTGNQKSVRVLVARLKKAIQPSVSVSEQPTIDPAASLETPSQASKQPDLSDMLRPPQQKGELGRLGPYRVLKILGAGGMGMVFAAEDPNLKRHVALKVMRPTLAQSKESRQRFLREARATAAIEHDHIVSIFQVGQDNGVPFLAMQLLKGTSLDDMLKRGVQLKLPQILRIGRETALGLAAAHDHKLIHRDIKPSNLWLEPVNGGRIKIVDFGLARSTPGKAGRAESHLTQTGVIMGTPAYMAPEQAQGEVNVDHRCDLFSLGAVLYLLSTGQLPFPGDDIMAILMSLAVDDPVPPKQLKPELPQVLSDLVLQLLEKDPSRRPQTARDVVERIKGIEKALEGVKSVPKKAVVAKGQVRSDVSVHKSRHSQAVPALRHATPSIPKKKNRAPLIVAVAAGLLAFVGGGWLLAQVIIRIQYPDGSETKIEPAERSKVVIGGDGKITVMPPGKKSGGQTKNVPNANVAIVEVIPPIANGQMTITEGKNKLFDGRGKRSLLFPPGDYALEIVVPIDKIETRYYKKHLNVKKGDQVILALAQEQPWVAAHTWKAHSQGVNSICFDPGNPLRFASCSSDATVKTWDLTTKSLLCTFKGNRRPVSQVLYDPSGRILFSIGRDDFLRGWRARNGKNLFALRGEPTGVIRCMGIHSKDGQTYVAAGAYTRQYKIFVWDLNTRRVYKVLEGHTRPQRGLIFTDDGKYLISGCMDKTIRVWDWRHTKVVKTLKTPVFCTDIVKNQDGRRLVAGCWQRVMIWNATTWELLLSLWLDRTSYRVCLDAKGQWLAALPMIQLPVAILDRQTGHVVVKLKSNDRIPNKAAFTMGNRWLVVGYNDGTITAWELTNALANATVPLPRKLLRQRVLPGQQGEVLSVAMNPTRSRIASGGRDGKLRVWHYARLEQEPSVLEGHTGVITDVEYRPNQTTASMDGSVSLWNKDGRGPSFLAHAKGTRSIARHPNGDIIATGGTDGEIKLWEAGTHKLLRTLKGHTGAVRSLGFDYDGQKLVSAGEDGTIKIWPMNEGDKVQALTGHSAAVSSVEFSPNDKHILSASEDGTCKLWDAATLTEIRTFRGHAGKVTSIAYSLDPRWFASASEDTTIKIWHVDTGQELLTLKGHSQAVNSVTVSRDGKWIVSGGAGATVRLWEIGFEPVPIPKQPPMQGEPKNTAAAPNLTTAELLTSPDWQWTPPTRLDVPINSSFDDGYFREGSDGLLATFHSDRPAGQGGFDLWMCTRQSALSPWSKPVILGAKISSKDSDDLYPSLSHDGLTLVFTSERPGGHGSYDLWISTRKSRKDQWSRPVNLGPAVNSKSNDGGGALSADGLQLIFASTRPGGLGKVDLWMTKRKTHDSPWSKATHLGPKVNTPKGEGQPFLSNDGLLLIFASMRAGTRGQYDLWVSTRKSMADAWSEPIAFGPPINSPDNEWSPALSADGRTLYFNRGTDIWMTRRVPK